MLDFAVSLALEAGAYIRYQAHSGFEVEHKGPIDLVTRVDREAQQIIVGVIRGAYPAQAILAGEHF